jgi:hypothetical protein
MVRLSATSLTLIAVVFVFWRLKVTRTKTTALLERLKEDRLDVEKQLRASVRLLRAFKEGLDVIIPKEAAV